MSDTIIWQDEMPPLVRDCPRDRTRCDGGWREMEGEGGKRGWLWTCTDRKCRYGVVMANG